MDRAGHVFTRSFTQEFGYFEARFRIAEGTGQNNAFWLTDSNTSGSPLELDISEAHDPQETTANYHTRTADHDVDSGKKIDTGVNLADDFQSTDWSGPRT